MLTQKSVRRAIRLALFGSAAVAAGTTVSANAADAPIQEVVVTGSRIAQPNLETTSPVTQVTAADIAVQGVTRVEDLINQLPQAFAAQNATVSNGATGTATVNLRGLGSPRTLVLVDGRRMPYGGVSSASAAPDLNMIPASMVERVEVLTGGASAVYGSDAIGGVVNFIMKKDFEGVQFDAMYGTLPAQQRATVVPVQFQLRDVIAGRAATNPAQFALPDDNVTDGEAIEFNFLMGVSTEDGRGNVTLCGRCARQRGGAAERSRLLCLRPECEPEDIVLLRRLSDELPGVFLYRWCGFHDRFGDGQYVPAVRCRHRPVQLRSDQLLPASGHALHPGRDAVTTSSPSHADVYTQVMYTDYESIAQIAPGGNFFDTNTVNCDNPLLSQQQLDTVGCTPADGCSRRHQRPSTSPVATSKAADARMVREQRLPRRARVFVAQFPRTGTTTPSVQYSTVIADQSALNYFHKTRLARST